ncbi:MAG: ABC transporter permease [Actinomycetota bacterium]|nr:ABC transporter permease [Actinomycetota bacterium]
MNRLVRAELLKQRTTPVFLLAFAAVPVIAALVTYAVYSRAGDQGNDPLGPDSLAQALGAPASVLTLLVLLLGIVGMSGEYRHQTITNTLLVAPRRRDVVVAKMAAHTVTGVAMAMVTLAVASTIAVPWLVSANVPVGVGGDAVRVGGGLLLSTALHAALGVAIGALVRNQTAAIGGTLVWLLAVEGIIANVLRSPAILDWFPGALAAALVDAGPAGVSLGAAAAGLALYAAALSVLGARFVVNRDVT